MKKYSVTFGVDEDKSGKALNPGNVNDVRADAMRAIAKEYGGVTFNRNLGGWVNDEGRLVEERSFTLYVVDIQNKGSEKIQEVAQVIKTALNQSSVLVTSEDVEGLMI